MDVWIQIDQMKCSYVYGWMHEYEEFPEVGVSRFAFKSFCENDDFGVFLRLREVPPTIVVLATLKWT